MTKNCNAIARANIAQYLAEATADLAKLEVEAASKAKRYHTRIKEGLRWKIRLIYH